MTEKAKARRAILRDALLDAAEMQIVAGGLNSVKARDLAAEAGCALGAIYNVFDDLTELILAVNGRTFRALGKVVAGSQDDSCADDAHLCLIRMAHAYLRFAADNTNLWRALFDLKMSTDSDGPEWYLEEMAQLFAFIHKPLQQLFPDKPGPELDLMTRALFSSVHGIVLLGLEKRISGVPRADIERMITVVLSEIGN